MTGHGSTVPPAERAVAITRLRRLVARAVDHQGVLRPGERVLVACSGGPDSVALLDVLVRLGPPRGWTIDVAHVDHGLRPGSSDEFDLVAALAAARGVAAHRLRVDVGGLGSLQARARAARLAALDQLGSALGAGAIALGHTADDQAETVLMRALSGATPRALAAMAPRSGRRARPLLGAWRAETFAYCEALGAGVIDDPSNSDPRFLRTRVRHQLLPALEEAFPSARRRLVVLAAHQRRLLERAPPPDRGAPEGASEGPC